MLTVADTTITGNATGAGGAGAVVYQADGQAVVQESTIAANVNGTGRTGRGRPCPRRDPHLRRGAYRDRHDRQPGRLPRPGQGRPGRRRRAPQPDLARHQLPRDPRRPPARPAGRERPHPDHGDHAGQPRDRPDTSRQRHSFRSADYAPGAGGGRASRRQCSGHPVRRCRNRAPPTGRKRAGRRLACALRCAGWAWPAPARNPHTGQAGCLPGAVTTGPFGIKIS